MSNKIHNKLKGVLNSWIQHKPTTEEVGKDSGYALLMGIIDRKVFDVEDDNVSEEEFHALAEWSKEEYTQSTVISLSGRVIRKDPLVIVEVVETQPIFIEIHDYKARYRVNLYHATQEVDISVNDPVKDKELEYTHSTTPVYVL